jgi:hypothetical protein
LNGGFRDTVLLTFTVRDTVGKEPAGANPLQNSGILPSEVGGNFVRGPESLGGINGARRGTWHTLRIRREGVSGQQGTAGGLAELRGDARTFRRPLNAPTGFCEDSRGISRGKGQKKSPESLRGLVGGREGARRGTFAACLAYLLL